MADAPLSRVVDELLEKMREPLGLDRWSIKVLFGPGDDTAACSAMPEYRSATISLDPDRLQTGDELDELLVHELAHCLTWPLATVADDFAIAVAEAAPDHLRAPLAKLLKEVARRGEEEVTTDVGRACVTLIRRLWNAEAELTSAKAEIRTLKKASAA